MLTVIVITDEPLLEAGLKAVLSDSSEFDLAKSHRDAREISGDVVPDIIVCASEGEDESPLTHLRKTFPNAAIAVMRREFSPEFAQQALDAGMRGFISSTAHPEILKDCLRKIGRGELWMENSLSMMLLEARPVRLSKRQLELIYLLAQGLKNKEIAGILGISEGTVKAYLSALFEKMGAKDRFELALFGLKHLKHLSGQEMGYRTTRSPRPFVPRRLEKLNVA